MTVRQSTTEDLPQIIALLKQSIGEALTPKTEAYFLWKHDKNPFGKSKVLLAVEGEKIVGLRAFMHWRWVSKNENIAAVRAVDTATDPTFQGRGIFKTLTLQAVEECRQEGVGMIFNSPNPVSMQGYLKMGWSVAGRLPIFLKPASIFPSSFSSVNVNDLYNQYSIESSLKKLNSDWALAASASCLHTPVNYDYIQWRYACCPVAKYGGIIEPGKFGFVFRLKKINRFIELRICELWTEPGTKNNKLASVVFKKLVSEIKPALISCAASPLFLSGEKQIVHFFGPFKKGPVITIRPLVNHNLDNFASFNNWQPSLGSMELF